MDKDELWTQARELLLASFGPNDAERVFLGLLAPVGVFGDSVVLAAQNPQVEEWVKSNFVPQIEDALTEIAGRRLSVAVGGDPVLSQPSPQDASQPQAPQTQPPQPHVPPSSQATTQPASPYTSPDQLSPNLQHAHEQAFSSTPPAPSGEPATFPSASAVPSDAQAPSASDPDWLTARVSPSDISPAPVPSATYTPTTIPPSQDSDPSTANQALFGKCTFDTFVVGPSNEFARGAALAVAEQPGTAYNPLFIYGSSGLGKTHLLVAIANYARQNFSHLRTVYASANEFLNDYVTATQKNQWNAFNEKYHTADVLLIDDVQYLENKDETINQFFNIFNAMINKNKQVVLSADRAPRDINMDERMRSRFNSGLLADVKAPDYETRLAILKNYLSRTTSQTNFRGLIPSDVLEWLAEASTSNIREIEGAVTRLISNMSLLGKDSITVEEARELLSDFFPDDDDAPIEIPVIMSEVEKYFGVSHEDMISNKRHKSITTPRHVAIYLSRYLTEESLEAIGRNFGGRDHTTVMHSVSKIERDQKTNRQLFDQLETLRKRINEHH